MIAMKLKNKYFMRTLLSLSIPMILQNLITSCLNMMDTFMLGQLGETAIAAAGSANQVFFFFNLIVIGLTGGAGVFVAQYWGRRDVENINRVLGLVGTSCLVFGILIFGIVQLLPEQIMGLFSGSAEVVESGAGYLRIVSFTYILYPVSFCFASVLKSTEHPVAPMFISAVSVLTNIVLNYCFIFGNFGAPKLGIPGAALATLIARALELALFSVYCFRPKCHLCLCLAKMFRFDRDFVMRILRTALPVALNDATWALAVVMYTWSYSRLGTENFAAYQIINTVQELFLMTSLGCASACAVMVGNKIGRGLSGVARQYANRFVKISLSLGVVFSILLFFTGPHIIRLFRLQPETVGTVATGLKSVCILLIFKFFGTMMIIGVLRGGGDTKFAFAIEAMSMWLVGVPMALIGAAWLHLPVYIVVLMVGLEEVAKSILVLPRLLSGKWVKNVVSEE